MQLVIQQSIARNNQGEIVAEFAQDEILDGSQRLGYVGHQAGAAICFIVNLSPADRAAVIEAVNKHRNEDVDRQSVEPAMIEDEPDTPEPSRIITP